MYRHRRGALIFLRVLMAAIAVAIVTVAAACTGAGDQTLLVPSPTAAPSATLTLDDGPPPRYGVIGGRGALLSDGWRVAVPKLVFHELGDKVNIDGYYVGELQVTVTVRVTNAGRRTRRLALADVQVAAAGDEAPTFSDTRWMTDEVLYGLIAPGKSRKGTFGYLLRKDARHDLQVTVLPMGAEEAAVLLMPRRATSHVTTAPYRGGVA